MKISCDIITDLLPLYHDGVCNESSKKLVAEHLLECSKCRAMLEKMEDNVLDNRIKKEREEVVRHHAKAVKRKSLIAGISIASVMAIPVLVSMIINLATGRALDWFFIVLAALMTLASVTVVPLVFEKNRGLWTIGSFTGSLALLLLTSAIYSGGDWFFVAITPILFGMSLLFAPYVISRLPLSGFLAQNRGLLVMAVNTLLLYAIIIASGFYGQGSTWLGYWRPALLITFVCLLFPWGLFLIIRYNKVNVPTKSGLCVLFSGISFTMLEALIYWILEGAFRLRLTDANLLEWNNNLALNGNIDLLVLLTCGIIGAILLSIGVLRRKKVS